MLFRSGEKNGERINAMGADAESLRGEIGELSKKISDYEYMTGEHRKKVLDTFKDLTEMRQNMGSLSAQKELLEDRLSEIEGDMQKIHIRRDESKKGYEECIEKSRNITDFLDNEERLLTEAEEKVTKAEDKISSLVKQIYDTEAQVVSISDSLKTYMGLRDRFEGYIYSVRNLLSAAKNNLELSARIKGMIADVVSCDKEYEVAVETAFGGAM